MRQGRLGKQRQRFFEVGERGDFFDGLDSMNRIRCDGHRADGFFVALVADVDDPVALLRAHPDLVVDLGHQRAHGVDHEAAGRFGVGNNLGRRAVRAQHDRRAFGDLVDRVDEDDALLFEPAHDLLVVHDLVIAVHGRREGPHHRRQRLDRHLDTRAESTGSGEQDLICSHAVHGRSRPVVARVRTG